MNRKEVIEKLKNIRNVPSMFIDETIKDLVKVLEKPITLTDLLGWEEGVEYEYYPAQNNEVTEKAKIVDNIFYVFISSADDFVKCPIYSEDIPNMKQATKLEPKLKAYHVKDEYSYDCLMQELEEQGYVCVNGFPLSTIRGYEDEYPYVIEKENKKIMRAEKDDHNFYGYDLIEYHKEEPKYYAKIKGWELLRSKEYKGSDCGGKWFIYAPSVKEITTIPEYTGINDAWIASMTKTEWSKLGIDGTNADFERAG